MLWAQSVGQQRKGGEAGAKGKGKGVGAKRKRKIQQRGTRQRVEGYLEEITEGKRQNKKTAWRKSQRGDRGRYGIDMG